MCTLFDTNSCLLNSGVVCIFTAECPEMQVFGKWNISYRFAVGSSRKFVLLQCTAQSRRWMAEPGDFRDEESSAPPSNMVADVTYNYF